MATALALAQAVAVTFVGAVFCAAAWALGVVLMAVARWLDRPKE